MLTSAIENVPVDYILPVDLIGKCLVDLANDPANEPNNNPPISEEQAEQIAEALDDLELRETPQRAGNPSLYSCPDCNGVLWEVKDGEIARYRCRTGHAFSEQSLLSGQTNSVETALWTAVRALEERRDLQIRLTERARVRGQIRSSVRFQQQAEHTAAQAQSIRNVLSGERSVLIELTATEVERHTTDV